MENKKPSETTEAALQIERLKQLKQQKDEQAEKLKSEAFKYIDTPKTRNKPVRTARISKSNFDELHKIVNKINKTAKSKRVTKDKLINLLITRFVELEINYNEIKNKDEFVKMLSRLDIK